MSKGLEELKRLAYENACCRCQYYIDKKCTNNYECVWKTIEKELKTLEIIKDRLIVVDKGKYIEVFCEFSIPRKSKKYDLLKEVLL